MASVNKKTKDLIHGKYYSYKSPMHSAMVFLYIGRRGNGQLVFEQIEIKTRKTRGVYFYLPEEINKFVPYKEPVVHTKYLYWVRPISKSRNKFIRILGPFNEPIDLDWCHKFGCGYDLLKEEIITYTEN